MAEFPLGLHVDRADAVAARLPGDLRAAQDGDPLAAVRGEPDTAGVERIRRGGREFEYFRALKKKVPLFGIEHIEPGQVDDIPVGLNLREIGECGEVQRQIGRQRIFGVQTDFQFAVFFKLAIRRT